MTTYNTVLYATEGAVAVIRMNRVERRNAFTPGNLKIGESIRISHQQSATLERRKALQRCIECAAIFNA